MGHKSFQVIGTEDFFLENLNWTSEEGFIAHIQDFKRSQKWALEKVKKTKQGEMLLVNERNKYNLMDELWKLKSS